MNPKLTADRIGRRAIVYIRQSSMGQVMHNHESQRRQYGLVDRARALGFHDVVVIDDDLGRSGSGLVERPGFQRLVADVCTGQVGAIFCIEASRLARNGRDWHHLIELCGMVGAVVIDPPPSLSLSTRTRRLGPRCGPRCKTYNRTRAGVTGSCWVPRPMKDCRPVCLPPARRAGWESKWQDSRNRRGYCW